MSKKYIIKIYKRKLLRVISNINYKLYSDESFIKKQYKKNFNYELDLKNTKKFNEKIQWLKLNDRNPKYTKLVDKYEVRNFVEKKIGQEYLIQLYGVYNDIKEINVSNLPERFVLKTTHDSGGVIVCNNKDNINWSNALKEFQVRMKQNYYYLSREYHYKEVKPRIICEELLIDKQFGTPPDYKIFCFNGEPKYIQVDFNRFTDHRRNFYDIHWNLMEFTTNYNKFDRKVDKPNNLGEMIKCSEKLSKGIKFCRVDFYSVDDRTIFGEITFFPEGGASKFIPEKYDEILGDMLDIR